MELKSYQRKVIENLEEYAMHPKRYAKRNIGKEPIDWLVSVCKPCHDGLHGR